MVKRSPLSIVALFIRINAENSHNAEYWVTLKRSNNFCDRAALSLTIPNELDPKVNPKIVHSTKRTRKPEPVYSCSDVFLFENRLATTIAKTDSKLNRKICSVLKKISEEKVMFPPVL